MSEINKKYCELLSKLLEGEEATYGRFLTNQMLEYDMAHGFPLITQRKIYPAAAIAELNWMFSGSTNVKGLGKYKHFWKPWANGYGDVPTSYGRYLVNYPGLHWASKASGEACKGENVNQLSYVLKLLQTQPDSRRAVISLWHPDNAINSDQPACHVSLIYTKSGERLDCLVTARSQDVIMGLPYDLVNYGLLLVMMAAKLDLHPGKLSFCMANVHVYQKHLEHEESIQKLATYWPSWRSDVLIGSEDSWIGMLESAQFFAGLAQEIDTKFELIVNHRTELD